MAKTVYDPTNDRKANGPTDSKAVNDKIKNGNVKVKGKAKRETKAAEPKPEKPKDEKPKKPTFTDEQFIVALKAIDHPATSREIVDKLGIEDKEYGRALVRREMASLADEKKVKITKEKREYRYSVA
jgi:cell division septation protein DedD